MNVFVSEIVTPAAHLPVTVAAADMALASGVVEELERGVLWRAIVRQERRILIDCRAGESLPFLELEPVASIVSLTRWTPTDPAEVIDAASYTLVSRDPAGALISPSPGHSFPAPLRPFGSFTLTYLAGWTVTPETAPLADDGVNEVPVSVQHMIERAIKFRAGSGVGDLTIGSLKIGLAKSYKTDRIPPEVASIGRAWAYRPGLFSARP